ncbi:hypothetical protein CsSME_00038755 [Camellia sinensis var. sinensis]
MFLLQNPLEDRRICNTTNLQQNNNKKKNGPLVSKWSIGLVSPHHRLQNLTIGLAMVLELLFRRLPRHPADAELPLLRLPYFLSLSVRAFCISYPPLCLSSTMGFFKTHPLTF